MGVLVERRERLPPRIPVLGHLLVAIPVALAAAQSGIDHLDNRDSGFVVLCEQAIAQSPSSAFFLCSEERRVGRSIDSVEDHASCHWIPMVGFGDDVEARKTATAPGSGA